MSAYQHPALPEHPELDRADDLPPALQQSLRRHRDNLASMVSALRAAGLDEAGIDAHLGVLIDSYRAELAAALRHLGDAA